jgi:hypothetical protein
MKAKVCHYLFPELLAISSSCLQARTLLSHAYYMPLDIGILITCGEKYKL